MPQDVPDHSIRISIDRGGTFTDCLAQYPGPDGLTELVVKLLSVDKQNYPDAPTEAIRRVLSLVMAQEVPRGQKLSTKKIEFIRLSTTVATNALLERKGEAHALVITKGFKDLLKIGNQSRPAIFALHIRLPPPLYSTVLEVDERVTVVGYTSDPKREERSARFDEHGCLVKGYDTVRFDDKAGLKGSLGAEGVEIVQGVSGEAVAVLRRPDEQAVRNDLQGLYDEGYRSLAIVFAHSYTYPDHEETVATIAREIGFTHLSVSSSLLPMIKLVPRGTSTTADAYLTPVLQTYMDSFFDALEGGKDQGTNGCRVEYMGSDGGLVPADKFSGLKSILSGPAGGVVGLARTSWSGPSCRPVIGLDMGGTSTDVSRFAGTFEIVFETTTAGIAIQSPQASIDTVAAGGGSCLAYENGLFKVGPQSAGATPGPVCYRKGGPLAITDANVCLGRIIPSRFPKIFGPSADEALDVEASMIAMQNLADDINQHTGDDKSRDEVAMGFIRVANETMARPIRAITEGKGQSLARHVLSVFGGAGGQHAVGIARVLGIDTILIHKHSSILSAYGLSLADRVYEVQSPASAQLGNDSMAQLKTRWQALEAEVVEELRSQGFKDDRIQLEVYLNCRFDGTDTALMTLRPAAGEDFRGVFIAQYKQEFGFILDKPIMVDDVRVKGIGKSYESLGKSVWEEMDENQGKWREVDIAKQDYQETEPAEVFFEDEGRISVPVFRLDSLVPGIIVPGPAIILDDTSTVILDRGSRTHVTSRSLLIKLS